MDLRYGAQPKCTNSTYLALGDDEKLGAPELQEKGMFVHRLLQLENAANTQQCHWCVHRHQALPSITHVGI